MPTAYIIETKPESLYASGQFITGRAYDELPIPDGSGDYATVVYPTGSAVVHPYTP